MNSNRLNSEERVTFFNGQRIEANDLEQLITRQQELRHLHNRSLHNWGIGSGLAITGNKDAREVNIGAGYALDSLGREILLADTHTEPVPPVAGENGKPSKYYLTISYPDANSISSIETRESICSAGSGAVRLQEKPIFCWIKINENGQPQPEFVRDIEDGLKIVLAQVEVLRCRLANPVSLGERRNAKPPTQPFITAGQTLDMATPWRIWSEKDEVGQDQTVGIEVDVDLPLDAFRQTPNLIIRVGGHRFAIVENEEEGTPDLLLAEPIGHVERSSAQQFTLRAIVVWKLLGSQSGSGFASPFPYDDVKFLDVVRSKLYWHVVWMGIEG